MTPLKNQYKIAQSIEPIYYLVNHILTKVIKIIMKEGCTKGIKAIILRNIDRIILI